MDLVCTPIIFLKATMYIAIGANYIRMDSMKQYVELENETYIYCKQMNGSPLKFDKNGILMFATDKQKT